MLVTIEKAIEILAKGKHVMITTTDGKVALVPSDKTDLHMTAAEAVNMMFYVVRSPDASLSLEALQAQIQAGLEVAVAKAKEPTPEEIRQQKYREIRGIG
ncbi:MAG: hypothetical protein NW237_09550 [Cyanobacteriota bacterium]|nr:hypothetical protein [Cyanobacteriota bacterium]